MNGTEELERAVGDLEALAACGGRPDRYQARALLIALGRHLGADPEDASGWVERARAVGRRLGSPWDEAARAELALACAEHVHSADPRYLDLENYDWEYTRAARERLEARFVAAQALSIEAPRALREGVRRADRLLASRLESSPAARKSRRESGRG